MREGLPVLAELPERSHSTRLGDEWKLIGVQHLMTPCAAMLEAIHGLGLRRDHMHLRGKAYSTNQPTLTSLQRLGYAAADASGTMELGSYGKHLLEQVEAMWSSFSQTLEEGDRIIVLDDGGYTLRSCPPEVLKKHEVYGIEQTSSGIWDQPAMERMPVINVAASAAKVLIEPRIVAESVRLRIGKLIEDLRPRSVGVVGYGNVGKAIYHHMSERYVTFVHDHSLSEEERHTLGDKAIEGLPELLERADVILSSTGRDVSHPEWLFDSTGDRTLVSLSSSDVEFNWLIRSCVPYLEEPVTDPLQTLHIRTPNGHLLRVLRGGMVANFTGESESGPEDLIQMTRGLLLGAVIQIARDRDRLRTRKGAIMLDPAIQKNVMDLWLADQPDQRQNYQPHTIAGFSDVDWIAVHSAGERV